MADQEVSVILREGKPMVSSLRLAEHFGIKHKNVLRDIRAVLGKVPPEWGRLNFELTFQTVAGPKNSSRQEPYYNLTRDAFTLLAMGYNSARAIAFKLKYIAAFNALEAAAQAALEGQITAARQSALTEAAGQIALARAQGAAAALALSALEKTRMRRALAYKGRGLTIRETAKLMDCSARTVWFLLKTARELGLGARHAALQ